MIVRVLLLALVLTPWATIAGVLLGLKREATYRGKL